MRHLTIRDIDRFRRGEISGSEVLDVSRHLSVCADCSAIARDRVGGVDAGAEIVRAELGIDDAATTSSAQTQARPWKAIAAAAAVAAVLVPAAIVMTRSETRSPRGVAITPSGPPPLAKRGYGRADWDSLVAEAVRSGRVVVPDAIRDLRRPVDSFRGTSSRPTATLSPTGEAVEAQQPRFTWTVESDGPYIVHVFGGREEVARSPKLSVTTWTPDRPLQRGVTYAWQVELLDRNVTVPSPPSPPALFRILDEKTATDVAEARRRFPGDHLLQGLLCARAGLQSCASSELVRHAADHPDDRSAQNLAASVREW